MEYMFLHQCLIPTALSPYPCLHIWRHWRKLFWLSPRPSSRSSPGWEHPQPPRALFCSLDNSGNQAAPVQAMAQLSTRHKITFFNHLWLKQRGWWAFFLQYSAHFRLYKWRIFCNFLIIRYFKQCSSSLLRVLSISEGFFLWPPATGETNAHASSIN